MATPVQKRIPRVDLQKKREDRADISLGWYGDPKFTLEDVKIINRTLGALFGEWGRE